MIFNFQRATVMYYRTEFRLISPHLYDRAQTIVRLINYVYDAAENHKIYS